MSGYSTRKRTAEQSQADLVEQLAVIAKNIEAQTRSLDTLAAALTGGFEKLGAQLQEGAKLTATTLGQMREQMRKSDKQRAKILECATSMDESLLDLVVNKELEEAKKNGAPEPAVKKQKQEEVIQLPASPAHVPSPAPSEAFARHMMTNHDLFFNATEL